MDSRMIAGIVPALVSILAGAARADARVPACSLLSANEIKTIAKQDTASMPFTWPVSGGVASACNYGKGLLQIVLVTGPNADKGYADFFKRNIKNEVKKVPVSGVGRSAYYMFPRENMAVLVVHGGRYTMGITMVGNFGVRGEEFRPTLLALAKAASSRVR